MEGWRVKLVSFRTHKNLNHKIDNIICRPVSLFPSLNHKFSLPIVYTALRDSGYKGPGLCIKIPNHVNASTTLIRCLPRTCVQNNHQDENNNIWKLWPFNK
jgi:hypothetical protein